MENNFVIIMAGGIGSRFWPMSKKTYPKQFQDIMGVGKTMLQLTIDRFEDVCPPENIYIVTNEIYRPIIKEQIPTITDEQILGEPIARNTAPCIAYAAFKIISKNPNANLVISPADHVVLDKEEFKNKILTALAFTKNSNALVTLGITPSRPDTGYGYINFQKSSDEVKKVIQFTEKPNLETAKKFIESGDYLWNAGIFIWNINTILQEFKTNLPEMYNQFGEVKTWYSAKEKDTIAEIYQKCSEISIDYGVLEKSKNVYVIESDFGWSDLGTWNSLYTVSDKDSEDNVTHGNITIYDSRGNIIKSTTGKKIVVQGLTDYIIVDTHDALMICSRHDEQMVKQFVKDLEK